MGLVLLWTIICLANLSRESRRFTLAWKMRVIPNRVLCLCIYWTLVSQVIELSTRSANNIYLAYWHLMRVHASELLVLLKKKKKKQNALVEKFLAKWNWTCELTGERNLSPSQHRVLAKESLLLYFLFTKHLKHVFFLGTLLFAPCSRNY